MEEGVGGEEGEVGVQFGERGEVGDVEEGDWCIARKL